MDQLERHSLEIQKKLNKKEKAAYQEILKEYEVITKEVLSELAALYEKTGKDGKITYSELYRFNDLQRFQQRILSQVSLLGSKNLQHIKKLLEESYDLSYSRMSYAIEKEAQVLLTGTIANIGNLIAISISNPIYGIRLNNAQKRDSNLINKGINDAINAGIKAGDTYGGIAKRIREVFKGSMKRSLTIARTETHRVRNKAEDDSSMNAHKQGVIMSKTWRNMDDEKVREKKKANHVYMEGQTVSVDENFTGIAGAVGPSPGNLGKAEEDINCRCFAQRKVVRIEPQVPRQAVKGTFEDWEASKRGGAA